MTNGFLLKIEIDQYFYLKELGCAIALSITYKEVDVSWLSQIHFYFFFILDCLVFLIFSKGKVLGDYHWD